MLENLNVRYPCLSFKNELKSIDFKQRRNLGINENWKGNFERK